jgi:hypothetical protein
VSRLPVVPIAAPSEPRQSAGHEPEPDVAPVPETAIAQDANAPAVVPDSEKN